MVLSTEQLDGNVKKKKTKKTQLSSVLVPPVYRHQPLPLSLGSLYQLSWKLSIYPPSPRSSHFRPNHSRVRSKLAEVMTTFTFSFRSFLSPNSTSISFLPFVYINCFLEEWYLFFAPWFLSNTVPRVEVQ